MHAYGLCISRENISFLIYNIIACMKQAGRNSYCSTKAQHKIQGFQKQQISIHLTFSGPKLLWSPWCDCSPGRPVPVEVSLLISCLIAALVKISFWRCQTSTFSLSQLHDLFMSDILPSSLGCMVCFQYSSRTNSMVLWVCVNYLNENKVGVIIWLNILSLNET